eukprot:CAMPEP_0176039264 /NCGR_PEP_ID=MMETSP0120_2-20121206/19463_1 /TAXON_ID=160619 /ORGANISM="Kryptoperidinium foliaceum, Strain CCMP 1326" /LENGTH=77 /DNA_ID=CAMNT_0017372659 /DNA_START=19 /DNA_END=249 /DNA_ORIENTATION=-
MLRVVVTVAASVVVAASFCGGEPTCGRGVDASSLLQYQAVAAHCPTGHSSYGGSEALDVAWASDEHQIGGLKASLAS